MHRFMIASHRSSPRTRLFTSLVALALPFAAACGSSSDDGTGGDSGDDTLLPGTDTGSGGTDTNTPGTDTAGGSDTGTPGSDTGTPGTDTGTPGTDTGTPGTDTGGVVTGGVRYLGRVDLTDPKNPKLAWSGSGVVAIVTGAKISVKLTSTSSAVFWKAVIDGAPQKSFSVASGATQTVVLGDALGAGDHRVELYRETEGQYAYSVFGGFVDGTVKGAPAAGRLIEVIGDSITAGYGNLGVEIHPPWDNACSFTLDTESAYGSYASQLGRTLGAEVSIVARSGWGMVRDLGGSSTGVLSAIYDRAAGPDVATKWDFKIKPDAVVINLGTNDAGAGGGSDPGTAYETAYVSFAKTIRSHYPDAWFFFTFGTMTGDPMLTTMRNHVDKVVANLTAAGDKKVVAIRLDVQDATSTGCDYHPNVAEDNHMAAQLAPTMKTKLGW